MITYSDIESEYKEMGYKFFTPAYALNLFGIRMDLKTVDQFNDILGVAWTDEFGGQHVMCHKGTTKPGLYWLKNKKGNVNGTAILQPGQYLNCWAIGKHNGKYDALRQYGKPFRVWRDNDGDGELDMSGKTYGDVSGLNMHTTSFKNEVQRVGAYSAGCQVRQDQWDHKLVMALIFKAYSVWKNQIFSYTLFEG